jgi:hypothetical protein
MSTHNHPKSEEALQLLKLEALLAAQPKPVRDNGNKDMGIHFGYQNRSQEFILQFTQRIAFWKSFGLTKMRVQRSACPWVTTGPDKTEKPLIEMLSDQAKKQGIQVTILES